MTVIRSFSTAEEAHLARMRLGNSGIAAEIIDEATASVAPHIAFASGIRLTVADEDVARAREILGLPAMIEAARPRGIPWWVFAIAGVAVFTLLVQAIRERAAPPAPANVLDLDRNGDGRPDERTEFRDDTPVRAWQDNDFDGIWDVRHSYENGVPVRTEADLDFDGDFDSITDYRAGVPVRTTVRDGHQGVPLVRYELEHGVVRREWRDTDSDGSWDVVIDYDPFGRETGRTDLD
jgi:hypothetical protein